MGAMLHPVGPEPARTYWIRRALVLGVALILVTVVIVAVASVGSSPAATDPPEDGSTSLPASASATPTDSTTPAMPTALDTATPQDSSSAADTATPTSGDWPSSTVTPTTLTATPAETPAETPASAAPVDCDPTVLLATLAGKQDLKPKEANTFAISLVNGGAASCVLTVEPTNFELKIYSGTDRIWSSADCAKLVQATSRTLQSQQAAAWTMTWNGRRSRAECADRPEVPRPGTYFATAQYAGAQPVQLRMIVH